MLQNFYKVGSGRMVNQRRKLATRATLSIITALLGILLMLFSFVAERLLGSIDASVLALIKQITLIGGGVLLLLGIIFIIVSIVSFQNFEKQPRFYEEGIRIIKEPTLQPQPQYAHQVYIQNNEPTTPQVQQPPVIYNSDEVTYIPSQEAYQFVHMGAAQSVEDKFEQISRMDKTQFVVYIARLFSTKGYSVKLTPVMDNHDVDLLVEKSGVTLAVGCLLTNRVMTADDLKSIVAGKAYYPVTGCLALTNTFFDRSALDYARAQGMSLVDRNIIAQDFMK